MAPTPLHDYLFFQPNYTIGGVAPIVSTLWKQPDLDKQLITGIHTHAFPNKAAIEKRLKPMIDKIKGDGFSPLSGETITDSEAPHIVHLAERNLQFGAYTTLIRAQFGEYAPSITLALSGGEVFVTRKTANDKTEMTGCKDLALQFASIFGLDKFKVQLNKGAGLSKNELHNYWLNSAVKKPICQQFIEKVIAWIKTDLTHSKDWAADIVGNAPIYHFGKRPKVKLEQSAPPSSKKNVGQKLKAPAKPAKKEAPITFFFWIRHVPPLDHSHNMTKQALGEIVMAIANICRAVYGIDKRFQFFLFGDTAATTYGILPNRETENKAKSKKKDKLTIVDYMHQKFADTWGKDTREPELTIVDLRGFYAQDYKFAVPDHDEYKKKNEKDRAKRTRGLTYPEQYALYFYLNIKVKPRFIIGMESGNMDGFGYLGVPVISVEPADAVNQLEKSVLTDRIGNYTLLTPLWQLVNYGHGVAETIAQFRQYLYGAILTYTEYVGQLHDKRGEKAELGSDAFGGELRERLEHNVYLADEKLLAALQESLLAQFDIVDVVGDGNCLFRAVSRAQSQDEDQHTQLRIDATDGVFMTYSAAQIKAAHGFGSKAAYRAAMRMPAQNASEIHKYGGFLEILALANSRNRTIEVYSPSLDNPIIVNDQATPANPLRLYYVNGNHYQVLFPKVAEGEGEGQ